MKDGNITLEELDAMMARAPKDDGNGSTDSFLHYMTRGRASHTTECQCDECKGACERVPCLATPQDIERLIEKGHFNQLYLTDWCAGMEYGIPPIPIIQIRALWQERAVEALKEGSMLDFLAATQGLLGGRCPLWDKKTGLCTVHAYKPTEGRAGNCHEHESVHAMESVTVAVVFSWMLPSNRALVRKLFGLFDEKPFPYWPKEEANHFPDELMELPSEDRPDNLEEPNGR